MPASVKLKTGQAFILIDRYHWLWIALASPFLIFPTPKRSLAMLVIPFVMILQIIINRKNSLDREDTVFLSTPLNFSFLVIGLMVFVSLFVTYDLNVSLEKISGLILGFGIYYSIIKICKTTAGWWIVLVSFFSGGIIWALISLFGMNYQDRFILLTPIINRIPLLLQGLPGTETGLQHNAVGGTLLWSLPLFLTLSVYTSKTSPNSNSSSLVLSKVFRGIKARWALRSLFWLSTLFIISVIILTQSRGTYLALGITVIAMVALVLPSRRRWWLLLGLVLTAIILTVFLFQSKGWEGFISLLGLTEQAGFSLDSLASRLEIWPRAINGVQDFPFTGMGMNTFREVVHVLYPLFTISPDIDIAHAHNEFLQAALDLGIPGLIAFISIYAISFWMLIKIWKSANESFLTSTPLAGEGRDQLNLHQVMVLGLGGGLFGHLIFGMTDAISLGAKPGIFYWMLLGLITGLYLGIENWKIEN